MFAKIDHAAGASQVGMTMPPALVLLYGHPSGGTPVMLAEPRAAPDLPLRVLVREDAAGKAVIAFYPVAEALKRLGLPDDVAVRLEPAQRILVKAVQP
ncbi:MAG: DUF302 domain-containing protein [Rhodopila sp.]